MEEPQKVMVIVAHPDDAEFSCGGTIAKWAREGKEIIYVICTNGDKGSSDPEMTSERLAAIREKEQREAAQVLGVKECIFLGYPDGGLEDTSEFRGKLVRLLRMHQPDVVVTMDPYRRYWQHRDHRMAATVALDAVFPYARDNLHYPEHRAEGLTPHKVAEVYIGGAENPDTFIDISETFDQKIDALRCHVSQVGDAPKEEFAERLRQMAARFAQNQGREPTPMVEAFHRIQYRR